MARVFIGRLSDRADEYDVEKFFRNFGKVRDIVLKNGYGFVDFSSLRDAEDAVYELNGKELRGSRVVVELARATAGSERRFDDRRTSSNWKGRNSSYKGNGPPVRSQYRIQIENLSTRVSWQDLKDIFRKAGDVTFADAHKRRPNEGIVEYSNKSDLKAAVKMFQSHEINGRKLKLYCDYLQAHSVSRSRSRSTSGNARRGGGGGRRGDSERRRSSGDRATRRRNDSSDGAQSDRRSRSGSEDRQQRNGSYEKRRKVRDPSSDSEPPKKRPSSSRSASRGDYDEKRQGNGRSYDENDRSDSEREYEKGREGSSKEYNREHSADGEDRREYSSD